MKASSTPSVRQLYEDTADDYAAMMDTEIDLPMYARTLSRLADRIADIPGPIVDTSCGSGHMLEVYRRDHDGCRKLVGLDLSPRMVAITRTRLGPQADVAAGDMRSLTAVESGTAAAVVNYFALHHIDPDEGAATLGEWHRILRAGGQLVLATWEGTGPIDYDGATDVVALRYSLEQVSGWAEQAGFTVDRCVVEPVEEFPMDAVYLEATRG